MFSSVIGIIHFAASILALLSGTLVLYYTKGTLKHKIIGHTYAFSMLVVLVTSFMIYRLHGKFGVLHGFAVISSIALLGGMLPILFKWPKHYFTYHFSFMYWSVIGLYCAFAAEVLTRIPIWFGLAHNIAIIFYLMVGIATALVGGIGSRYFRKYKYKWEKMNSTP